MARKQSWAEKRWWWHGTVFDCSRGLLYTALALLLTPLGFYIALRQMTAGPVLDYYVNTHRSSCEFWEGRLVRLCQIRS
jgi:hypothetical protein